MPKSKDFAKIFHRMEKEYGVKKGKQVYSAWVNKHNYDDKKAFPQNKKTYYCRKCRRTHTEGSKIYYQHR